ncbi:MAG: NAD(P)-binding domain-containing protein, partial [Acidobacteriota bacterium]
MRRVAVVGLGLIGGSAALALEAAGFDRNPEIRARARRAGIRTADTLAEAAAGVEIAITAVPTAQTPALL